MKVAIAFPGCHRRGGVERVVFECARFLAGRGHEVTVYANEWEAADSPGVRYHHVPIRARAGFLRGLSFFRECSKRLDFGAYDVVNAHGCVAPLGGVHWAHSIHRAWLERCKQWRPPLSLARLKQRLNPLHPVLLNLEAKHFQHRRYQKVIALTPESKSDLMRLYGLPDGDIETIAPGFAPDEFNTDDHESRRASMRRDLGYTDTERVVVFVANELERKGFGPLVRAIGSLADPRVHLLVVGRVVPDAYRAEIDRLGLTGRVHFTGVVSAEDLVRCYAAADVFALPTEYEGWGLVIVEALACGVPVLTSRLAPASMVVREGQTGQLLDEPRSVTEIAAKLAPLLDGQHADRERVSRSVADYGWSNVLVRYERVLAECAANPGPRLLEGAVAS